MNKLFFSGPTTHRTTQSFTVADPNSSYNIACQRIVGLYRQSETVFLPRPEIIGSDIARATLGFPSETTPPHLIFRPFHKIRVLKGAYNVVHAPWGFNHLIDNPPENNPHPFLSQRTMLRACDEVWTSSQHAAALYGEHGVERVRVISSPVPCPDKLPARKNLRALLIKYGHWPSLSMGLSFGINNVDRHRRACCMLAEQPAIKEADGLRLYLTMLNPNHFHKNAEKLLRGFAEFSADHPDAVLFVKLAIDNKKDMLHTVQQNILLPMFRETTTLDARQIVFISPFLNEDELADLYRAMDFYICLSMGEGQNLALCEAMAQGVVPVAMAHTAMADYIDDSVGIVVPSKRTHVLAPKDFYYSLEGHVDAFDCGEADFLASLERTAELDDNTLQGLRTAAHARMQTMFAPTVIRNNILSRSGFDFSGCL